MGSSTPGSNRARIQRVGINPSLEDPEHILDSLTKKLITVLVPELANNQDNQTRRASFNGLDSEQERAARRASQDRRNHVKRRRERVRRAVITELFEELQTMLGLKNEPRLDQAKVLSFCVAALRKLKSTSPNLFDSVTSVSSKSPDESHGFIYPEDIEN